MNKKTKQNLIMLLILTQLGSGVLSFILSLKILNQNQSAMDFGTVILVSSIAGTLCSLLIGKWIDKYSKRWMMILAQLISIVGLTAFYFFGHISLASVIILSVFLQLSDTIFSTTLLSSAIKIVDNLDQLDEFNSLHQTINGISALISPLIAGGLYGFFSVEFFVVFEIILESLAILFLLKTNMSSKLIKQEADEDEKYSILEALKSALKNKPFTYFSMGMVFLNLALGSIGVGLPYLLAVHLQNNNFLIGVISFMMPVGVILAASIYPQLKFEGKFYHPVITGWLFLAVIMSVFGLILSFVIQIYWLFVILLITYTLVIGFLISGTRIPLLTYFQKTIPQNEQGRIFSVMDVVIETTIPLGAVVYGFLFDHFASNLVFMISGLALFIYLLLFKVFIEKQCIEI